MSDFRCRRYRVVGAAVMLGASTSLAFQPVALEVDSTKVSRRPDSRVVHHMAETSYSFGRDTSSFLTPLFQDYAHEWPRPRRGSSRGLLSASSLIFSTKGRFSFLEESNLYDDENILEYLPSGGAGLTPKTRELLQRVTSEYVNGGVSVVQVEEVLDVIDEEYKSRDVSVTVGDETFAFASSGEVDDADVARILSFAAYHRLPRDIALLLLGPTGGDQSNAFARCRNEFSGKGWNEVSFPQGLAIRPKRKFVKSTAKRFMPMPRAWMTLRKEAARKAQQAVNESIYVQAPPRRLLGREEFLATMEQELAATEPTELLPTLFRDARLFFPRQNQKLKQLRKLLKKQTALMKDAGLAGLISYVTLSLTWYTCAGIFQWRHATPNIELSKRAIRTALRRFGKLLVAAYFGSQLTSILRLVPFGNKVLRFTSEKLQISEAKASALLSGAVVGTSSAIWSIVVLGDAAVSRTAGVLTADQVGFESSI